MLKTIKKSFDSVFKDKCQYCGEIIEEESVKGEVKVPGYTGWHEKKFCNSEHLERWKEFVEEWEEKNYEIPESSKGCPTCVR